MLSPTDILLAEQVALQLATQLQVYLTKKAAGDLTLEDIHTAAASVNTDMDQLLKDAAAAGVDVS